MNQKKQVKKVKDAYNKFIKYMENELKNINYDLRKYY